MAAAIPQYPEVRVLSHDDALFVQQQAELDEFRRIAEARSPEAPGVLPTLSIFAYTKRQTEDLFSLNARLGLRYETLATLNGAASKDTFNARSTILIPSQDGLFVNNPPRGDLETMVLSTRTGCREKARSRCRIAQGRQAGGRVLFSRRVILERGAGVFSAHSLPLLRSTRDISHRCMDGGKIPLPGSPEFHTGPRYRRGRGDSGPCGPRRNRRRGGTKRQSSAIMSLLPTPADIKPSMDICPSISVTIHQKVSTGAIIGAVGHTGHATGPHLHFEVRTKKGTTDPLQLIGELG